MRRKIWVVIIVIAICSFFASAQAYSWAKWWKGWNNLCTIESPKRREKLSSYPVKIAVRLNEDARPETFRAWLNRHEITDKFGPPEDGVVTAEVGPEDGLRIWAKNKRRFRQKKNILKTKVRGERRKTGIDVRAFFVKVDAMETIGPEGGTIQAPDGHSITVPPNALDEPTLLSFTVLTPESLPEPLQEGMTFEGGLDIQPDGISFNEAITVKIKLSDPSIPEGTFLPIFSYNSSLEEYSYDGWHAVVDQEGFLVCDQITHLSVIFAVRGNPLEVPKYKNQMISILTELFEDFHNLCSFEEDFFAVGNINKLEEYINDPDLDVWISGLLVWALGGSGAEAVYSGLFNAIILTDSPNELCYADPSEFTENAKTIYHELMHRVFEKEDNKFSQIGYEIYETHEENLTYYMEHIVADIYVHFRLINVEDELSKVVCDYQKYLLNLNLFIDQAVGHLDGTNRSCAPKYCDYDPISEAVLNLLNSLIGLNAVPTTIYEGYEVEKYCGECEEPPLIEDVGCFSSHFAGGYYVQLHAEDPDHIADAITVTGPGIATALPLTYGAYRPGQWWSVPNLYLGQTPPQPQPPLTYYFNIESNADVYTLDCVVSSSVDHFATNLSPSGTASGAITFSWTGISLPGVQYQVQLNDANWNRIWDSPKTTGNSISYTGPALSSGSTYQYYVVAIYEGNQSLAQEEFVYLEEDFPVNFPDPNLESAIREAINKPTGTIMYSDLQVLLSLNAPNRGIIDIEGLQYCSNLISLSLYSNQISDLLPLSGLVELQLLWIYSNQISDISPLSGLVNLRYLILAVNQISDISPLSGLVNLNTLFLYNNQISDISPLSGLVKLTELLLYNNPISDISPLSGLVNLYMLSLGSNQLNDISPLSGLVNLKDLIVSGSQVSDISPLSGLVGLRMLILVGNQIDDLSSLSELINLDYLELGYNQISDLNPISSLVNLIMLSLNYNQITDLTPLSGLINLGRVELWDNQISNLEPLVNNPGIGNGDSVHLQGNPLSTTSCTVYIPHLESRGVSVFHDCP